MIFIKLRRQSSAFELLAIVCVFLASTAAGAQALAVIPVNVFMAPGQSATSLTVTNHGTASTSIQVRAYAWDQKGGEDHLGPTDLVVASPPIATIKPGATQVIRLILRQPAQGQEATYRILIDQIPPPAEPGVVHVVLRLSIPIFAQPETRALAHVQFHIESDASGVYLVGVNDGLRHEAIRDIALTTSAGKKFNTEAGLSPYILAGVTRRWHMVSQDPFPQPGDTLRLTAHADAGAIEEQVRVVAKP